EPIFVGALAIVVLLFALNLWGVFEIELPLVFTRAGLARPGDEGLASYFTSGLFATLLATPCSAPFLGTAMGFALAQSAGVILLIFIAVGLGLAAPYIVLALAPQMIGFLPKPGAWMLRVRTAMGFLLAAAVVWLVYVLASQVTPRGAALFTIALLLLAGVLVGREAFVRNGRYGGLQKAMTWIAGALIIVGGLSALRWSARTEEVSATTARGGARWQPFSKAALARATAEGQTVFLDITADWCFTCKFNEARVLSDADVLQAFRDHHIVLMRGDWTNHNAEIGHFLMTMGRAGIPFNAL